MKENLMHKIGLKLLAFLFAFMLWLLVGKYRQPGHERDLRRHCR